MHRPRDSGGSSTNRHYSTIHSVTQSYVTKAFHLQAHCGNPAILIAAARYPLQPFTPVGVLDRPCTPHSAPPPTACPLSPTYPSSLRTRAPNIPSITYSALILFCPVLAAEHPSIPPPYPSMQTRRASGCFQTFLHTADATPQERLKCSRLQEMFFKHVICQVALNVLRNNDTITADDEFRVVMSPRALKIDQFKPNDSI